MVGEMRDKITAKTAVEASLTGHLVFSTLHTNTAAETIIRLIEMGLEPFHFADVFLGVLAQRLARRLCDHCKEPYPPDKEEYDALVEAYGAEYYQKDLLPEFNKNLRFMRESSCEKCGNTGFLGRMGLHELLIGSPEIKNAIRHRATSDELKEIAISKGMRTLTMDGIYKMIAGHTDMNQVSRVVVND
jgi:type II secretory ATPase GspE/PulE/Tfp pilus assembly ATPase PilB-like protein